MKTLFRIFAACLALAPLVAVGQAASSSSSSSSGKVCHGKEFNPYSDPDWNDMFPITIMGVNMGGNSDPPEMYVPPVCVCPGIFGIPSPGVGVSYWQPMYLSEVQKIAGCSSSLGGKMLFHGYSRLNSNEDFWDSGKETSGATSMQLHWYEYPLFSMLDMFKGVACRSGNGYNLAYVSEVDPTWQSDTWGAIYSPEAGLFANLIAQSACAVDSVASDVAFPIDALFWCAGTWGGVYPLTGIANESISTFQVNNLVMAKFLARQARLGLAWQTIGPSAICGAHANPIWIKSEYRVDQVGPISRHGFPLVIGAAPVKQMPFMITNLPGKDYTTNLIWQGQECCIRTY